MMFPVETAHTSSRYCIPADATPRNYHLMVYCTDVAGNESYIARNIVLSTTASLHVHEK